VTLLLKVWVEGKKKSTGDDAQTAETTLGAEI